MDVKEATSAMVNEKTLTAWTAPSSDTEQDKQERTERMVREAVRAHAGFNDCNLTVYTKGSYPNNTNVRTDSDVDVGVQCHNVIYWGEHETGAHPRAEPYRGKWTPGLLRSELVAALRAKFPGQVDESGSTAIRIHSSSARVDADVVPCFDYHYYFAGGSYREGAKTFRKTGSSLVNYPAQHLENGRQKNRTTSKYFKSAVRIFKRIENAMVTDKYHGAVPSYFIECLLYNCPNEIFGRRTWVVTTRDLLVHIWDGLDGNEPMNANGRWLEVNECKYLFSPAQPWSREDGRSFAKAAWNYLGFSQ